MSAIKGTNLTDKCDDVLLANVTFQQPKSFRPFALIYNPRHNSQSANVIQK